MIDLTDTKINSALSYIDKNPDEYYSQIINLAKIPSSTFHEEKKILYLERLLEQLGLGKVFRDQVGNCVGYVAGCGRKSDKKKILFTAHADTACQTDRKIDVKDDKDYFYGHGVCDNCAGIVALLGTLKLIKKFEIPFCHDAIVAFTVSEEGLGGKKGMKEIIKTEKNIDAVVNVESHDLGRITNQSLGQFRAQITVDTQKSGHSVRNFGLPNAILIVSSIIFNLAETLNRLHRKVTYNFDQLAGGAGINVIAQRSSVWVEIRSEDGKKLKSALAALRQILGSARENNKDVKIEINVLVNISPVLISPKHRLYTLVKKVHKNLRIKSFFYKGNSDGDISMMAEIPTVTIGAGIGFKTHSLEEHLEKKSYPLGLKQVFLVLLTMLREY